MLYFNCDYMTGAHPDVLKKLCETNMLYTPGYGGDSFTQEARRLILEKCNLQKGAVYFLSGGTQTNKIVIDRLLSRNDGVLCCETAHINVHESGAIEADGHKVLALPSANGKLSADAIRNYVEDFYKDETHIHMVRPAMVYITHPTELGTLYSLEELRDITATCRRLKLPLFIDGARLAYGLAADKTDVRLSDIAVNADVFYIGGTKCGALFGEAVVTSRSDLLPRFDSFMKLHGGLLAKGRILSLQFMTLFSDDLYYRIGGHGVSMAKKLRSGFEGKGYEPFIDSPTNQQFFRLPNEKIDYLKESVGFDYWGPRGESHSVVRFVTDWSTKEEDVDRLIELI